MTHIYTKQYLNFALDKGSDVILVLEDGQRLQEVLLQPLPVLCDLLTGAPYGTREGRRDGGGVDRGASGNLITRGSQENVEARSFTHSSFSLRHYSMSSETLFIILTIVCKLNMFSILGILTYSSGILSSMEVHDSGPVTDR